MIHTIEIPRTDLSALMDYLRKGRIVMPELIGRVYTIEIDCTPFTIEVMAEKCALRFSYLEEELITKSPMATVGGITVCLDVDRSYE